MTLTARRRLFLAALVACMPLTGWAGTYQAWRWLAGDDVGTSLAEFWDLQVESYFTVLLVVVALHAVYGMHRTDDGRWGFAPRAGRARVAAYLILLGLVLVCSAEAPVRAALQLPLPDDFGVSVAHYFRRGLEGVLASLGLMVFLDVVRPGALGVPVPRAGSSSAENATAAEPETVGRG